MPTYDYQCETCGKTFEFFQSMKAEPLEVCPQSHCQQERWCQGKVRRLLGTGAGLLFKGSGFYITDYRSTGYQAAAKSDTGAAKTAAAASPPASSSGSSGSGGSSSGGSNSSSPAPSKP